MIVGQGKKANSVPGGLRCALLAIKTFTWEGEILNK